MKLPRDSWQDLILDSDGKDIESGFFKAEDGTVKYAVDSLELISAGITQIYAKMSADPQWMGLGHIGMTVVGGNLAESHCERTISAANLIVTAGRTLLSSEFLEQLCVLRMNRDYMIGARKRYVTWPPSQLVPAHGPPCLAPCPCQYGAFAAPDTWFWPREHPSAGLASGTRSTWRSW